MPENKCQMCGQCCYLEVPVTILDIYRISEKQNQNIAKVYHAIIDSELSKKINQFILARNQNGACLYLGEDNLCKIHSYKPYVCQFHQCEGSGNPNNIRFTLDCSKSELRENLLEDQIAQYLTRDYLEAHSIAWNPAAFHQAVDKIFQKIRAAKAGYQQLAEEKSGYRERQKNICESCDSPGICAQNTPVSLADIQRIADYLDISYERFFTKYIDLKRSQSCDTWLLKKSEHCIFLNFLCGECTIQTVAPWHCYFTPCLRLLPPAELTTKYSKHKLAMKFTQDYIAENGIYLKQDEMLATLKKLDAKISS